MAAPEAKRIAIGVPGTGPSATFYTSDKGTATITNIFFCNTAGSAATITLHHNDDGTGTYANANALYSAFSIAANTTHHVQVNIHMKFNAQIGASQGTANAVTVSLYGVA